MDQARRTIERALEQRADTVHHVELSGRVRGAHAHAARGASRHPGAVPRHVPSLRADARVSRRTVGAVGAESDQPSGADAERRAVAGREHRGVLQTSQGGAAVLGAGRLRHVVHGAASRSVAVTREPERSGAVQAPAARRSRASRRSPAGPRATCGRTRRPTTFRCCRSTNWATRASAASRARRCRSIRRTRARAAGRARSSNAGFIFRRSKSSTPNSQIPNSQSLEVGSWLEHRVGSSRERQRARSFASSALSSSSSFCISRLSNCEAALFAENSDSVFCMTSICALAASDSIRIFAISACA